MKSPLSQTDEEIILQIQNGNKDIYAEILNRYEKKMERYVKRYLQKEDEIIDIVQDVFIKVYTNILSFDPKQRFSPWIYRIAHNECVNKLSWKSVRNFISLDIDFDEVLPSFVTEKLIASENTEKEFELNFHKENLTQHIDKLDSKYKDPIILYFLEDMSYEEISDILKIPVSTVGIRIKRGKEKLKTILEKENYKN
jgi:RNA polymerase sigma-70 factor (ECF subfamily)